MKIGGGSMSFTQGKSGGHINLCTHIRELCYTKGIREEGQENLNMASLQLHHPSPASK